MPRPKPDTELVQVLLRLHPDVLAVIDKLRGDDLSRAAWITACIGRDLGDRSARATELKTAKAVSRAQPEPKDETVTVGASVQFGPVKRIGNFKPAKK